MNNSIESILSKVKQITKKQRDVFYNCFKEMSSDSILKKGLKETYKSSKRNHLKLAVVVDPENLSNKSLLNPFLEQLIQNKVPFFCVSSLKEISKLVNKDFSCSCAGLLQNSRKFDTQLRQFSELIYAN